MEVAALVLFILAICLCGLFLAFRGIAWLFLEISAATSQEVGSWTCEPTISPKPTGRMTTSSTNASKRPAPSSCNDPFELLAVDLADRRTRPILKDCVKSLHCERATLLTTKFERWRYEREVRLISRLSELKPDGPRHFKPFGNGLKLVEVIAGARCCSGWRDPLK